MDVKAYIESGILELYVAGALSEVEQNEVESMLAKHAEIRNEIASIEQAFENYAMAHAIDPPKEVLDHIMSVVKDRSAPETTAKTIQMKPAPAKSTNWLRYLAYAASLLLFISLAINVYYYNSFKRVEGELAELSDQNSFLTNQYDVVRADYNNLQAEFSTINNPNVIAITMKGQVVSPNSSSLIYWDKSTGNVYVSANNLPACPDGHQYQLWALKDGKPIDAGMIDMNGKIQGMKNITEADAFAVTLEPAGGSASPTMEKLFVVGTV